MRVMLCLLAAIAIVPQKDLTAQNIRGRLLDRGSQSAIPYAQVMLIDSAGGTISSTLTSGTGHFALSATRAGIYRLRADRIGYEAASTDALLLEASDTLTVTFEMEATALALDEIRVETAAQCSMEFTEGTRIERAWREATKGLAVAESSFQPRLLYSAYGRELDTDRRVVRELYRRSVSGRGQVYRPAAVEVVRQGYVADSVVWVPTVELLLTDFFTETHCFELTPGDSRGITIKFTPTPDRRSVTEIAGTVRMDSTFRVRQIEFQFVNLSQPLANWPPRGELVFDPEPDGRLVLTRWHVRLPKYELRTSSAVIPTTSLTLAGFREEGAERVDLAVTSQGVERATAAPELAPGSALQQDSVGNAVGPEDAEVSDPVGPVRLFGRVVDHESGAPIIGAELVIGSTSAITDESGRFAFPAVPTGAGAIAVSHIGYGSQRLEIIVGTASPMLEIRMTPTVISLRPLDVTVAAGQSDGIRLIGGAHRSVAGAELAEMSRRGMTMEDALRTRVSGLSVRSGSFSSPDNPSLQRMLCIEGSRGATRMAPPRAASPYCDMVAVVIDGAVVANAGEYLYAIGLQDFTQIEYLSPVDAGFLYGMRAGLAGVLRLTTRKR